MGQEDMGRGIDQAIPIIIPVPAMPLADRFLTLADKLSSFASSECPVTNVQTIERDKVNILASSLTRSRGLC